MEQEEYLIGGYVRTIVDGDGIEEHNTFKKGEIYQIKSIDSDGLVNFNQDGPRLYRKSWGKYPKECEWIGMELPSEVETYPIFN